MYAVTKKKNEDVLKYAQRIGHKALVVTTMLYFSQDLKKMGSNTEPTIANFIKFACHMLALTFPKDTYTYISNGYLNRNLLHKFTLHVGGNAFTFL